MEQNDNKQTNERTFFTYSLFHFSVSKSICLQIVTTTYNQGNNIFF